MKKHFSTILLVLVFVAGLSLLLYPTVSNYWNSLHQSRAVASYVERVSSIDNSEQEAMLAAAHDYNTALAAKEFNLLMEDYEMAEYNSILDVTGTGIMAYVDIPQISCLLPIYHGTDEAVLQIAVGHIPGTSLPVGGESSHCVISGHRGLPSARLFTDIDRLIEGDIFMLRTLNEVYTYEVCQIRIVLPHEVNELVIQPGEDLCTLVTCTPYGINTHRMLVTGRRIENIEQASVLHITADAVQVEPLIVAPALALPCLVLIVFALTVSGIFGKKKNRSQR